MVLESGLHMHKNYSIYIHVDQHDKNKQCLYIIIYISNLTKLVYDKNDGVFQHSI